MTAYIELRAHTCYSFSDGAISAEGMAKHARRLGYSHLGITDTADLGAVPKFAVEAMSPALDAECKDAAQHETGAPCRTCMAPVRPIIGAELVVDGYPAAFIARTPRGYQNLAALVTLARMGQWSEWDQKVQAKRRGRPKITWAHLAEHSTDLHALTGPATGELASLIRRGKDPRRALNRWREVFTEKRLSIEVQMHHTGGHESALAASLIELAEGSGIPWVVTQDPRYIDAGSRLVHDMLTANRYGLALDAAAQRGLLHPNNEWRLISPHEMAQRWEGREQGLRESRRIAEEATGFTFDWMRPPMPDFRKAKLGMSDRDDDEALRQRTEEGIRERWGEPDYDQRYQIEHELKLIKELGFAGFFLVMADAIRFARSRNILCQGRGSAANSAVAFCLGITAIDPVENGLLFERFLSNARVNGHAEPPDIDVDFEHNRREEVLDYMYNNYDREHAAITAVSQYFHAPTAVQDAMRALGYPAEQIFEISKRVHHGEPSDCVSKIPMIAEARGIDIGGGRWKALETALPGFDGLVRLRSTHVGGFVLSAKSLGHYLPVEQTTMGRTIVQFDKDDLDMIGVPKFDFLGLGALTMTRIAFDVIEEHTGKRPNMYTFADRDEKTYDLIRRGETIGTFQIESRAQINSILHTKPDHLYDLVVQVALIRPGPIQASFVHPYTERRLGRAPVKFAHPDLRDALLRTQGIPIFQEQAMAIAMKLGGYTATQADLLRRTMGNIRKKGRLEAALSELKRAMVLRGVEEDIAATICKDLVSFANYGFPESHAWSFAMIAYVTAYLKAHYPMPFFIGLLNAQPMGFYPISTLIHDAKRHGVEVRPPCLATGSWECTAEWPAMRIGWKFVRGIRERVINVLKDNAPFYSIEDVVRRGKLNRAEVLAFAQAGAFEVWSPDRRHAAWEGLRACGDVLPLAPATVNYHEPVPIDRNALVHLDYHAVGMSIYGHPMEFVREKLSAGGAIDSAQLMSVPNGRTVTVGGLVTIRQRPETAGGTIFLLLEDEHGYVNVVVSKDMVVKNEEVVKRAPFVLIQGRVENDGAAISVVGRRFKELEVRALTHPSRDFR